MMDGACAQRAANGSVPAKLSVPGEAHDWRGDARLTFAKAGLFMHPGWSAFRARVSNRLARHLCATPFRLQNTSPMVSFTFDDAPKSAATIGAPMLEEHGAHGTFYISGGLVDKWSGHWTGGRRGDTLRPYRQGHCPRALYAPPNRVDRSRPRGEGGGYEKNPPLLLGARPLDQNREFRVSLWLRIALAQAEARQNLPFVPRHSSRRQQRHRGPAVSARHAFDRGGNRPRENRSYVRRSRRQKRLADLLYP